MDTEKEIRANERQLILKELEQFCDGDILPDDYWDTEIKGYGDFPMEHHNALVSYVIGVRSELIAHLERYIKEKEETDME